MKNVQEIYEKYYNAYNNDYDNDELNEGKKKIDYRQFELFDKTDKKLDGETKIDEESLNSSAAESDCIAKMVAL